MFQIAKQHKLQILHKRKKMHISQCKMMSLQGFISFEKVVQFFFLFLIKIFYYFIFFTRIKPNCTALSQQNKFINSNHLTFLIDI